MKPIMFVTLVLVALISASVIAGAEEMLMWEECVKEAKQNNPDLTSAKEMLNQARASKEITRSAALPQISGDGSEITTKGPSSAGSGSSSQSSQVSTKSRKTTTYQYELTGEQLVFDSFKTSYDLSTAERNIIASRYNYDVTSSNVRLRLRSAFIALLESQELLKVTEEIEVRRRQNAELVKLRYEGGREHKGSLLTAEANLAQAIYDVTQARRAIYLSQRRLSKELARAVFTPMTVEGDLEVRDQVRERPDFEKLGQTNPLLSQLIAQKEAAKFGVKSAYAQLFPQVYASGSMGNTSTQWFPDKNEWSVGTTIKVPIFDGGNTIATISKAKATLGQAQADERSGRDGVILTLSDTWTQLQNSVDMVEVQRKFVEATRERSRIAESEYSIGLLLFDNWIIIEDDYVKAKKAFLAAQTAALIAEASWVQAKGGTLDYD
jgi:outer membrane protein TolC